MQRRATAEALRAIGVGERYLSARWDEVHPAIRGLLQHYVDNLQRHMIEGVGLILAGGYGTGKTSAMVLVADAALVTPVPIGTVRSAFGDEPETIYRDAVVLWTAGAHLYRMLHRPAEYRDEIARLETADLLVIDDFDQLYSTAWNILQLEALMDARYGNRLATCMTLNNLDVLKQPELSRLRDRVRESAVVAVLGDDIPSRRARRLNGGQPPGGQC